MIKITYDQQSIRHVERQIVAYAKRKGVAMESIIDELAGDSAKQLASRIQPWGLSVAKMKKFERSIGAQVNRAIKNANITPGGEGAAEAHERRRGRDGTVPKGLPTGGQFKRYPISIADRKAQAELKKKGAGSSKAAWLEAGKQAYFSLKFPKYFSKKAGGGKATKKGRGMNREIILENRMPYISRIMKSSDISTALKRAYRGLARKMQRALEKP